MPKTLFSKALAFLVVIVVSTTTTKAERTNTKKQRQQQKHEIPYNAKEFRMDTWDYQEHFEFPDTEDNGPWKQVNK